MRRVLMLITVVVSLAVTGVTQQAAGALPAGTKVQTYKSGLAFPIDFAWVPGTTKFFFTEKNTGRIRVMIGRRLLSVPCRDLSVSGAGESGALGLVLHPNYKQNHWLYVFFTNNSPRENRVVRFKVENNRCVNRRKILSGLPASTGYHNGGQLEFMNGKLFITVGENHNASNSQNTDSRLGKVLRVNAGGSVPSTNPFGNKIFSYGHRNGFGLAAHPTKSWLFESENGPDCDDELNRIVKGDNYGWGPGYPCGTNPGHDSLFSWTPPIAPTDLWWYTGRMKALSGRLYMGDNNTGRLHKFRLNSSGTQVTAHSIVVNLDAPIIDVTKGPRGWLYFSTDSAIYRIVPS